MKPGLDSEDSEPRQVSDQHVLVSPVKVDGSEGLSSHMEEGAAACAAC